ncbi:MAG TPA: single-stranded DNA-binding protein [Bacteroidia bacterium]|nr:single-stranded DNA-binding protein [Bacteroidia bacterium]
MNIIRNNVQLVGNLGQNPDIKELENGKKMARFSIACQESFLDRSGKKTENTQWFTVVAWDGLAGIAEKYMHKGKQVAISGRLINRSWTDKEGNKKSITEIIASDILLLGGSKK